MAHPDIFGAFRHDRKMQEETDGEGSATGDIAPFIEAVEATDGDAWVLWCWFLLGFSIGTKSATRPKQANIGDAGS